MLNASTFFNSLAKCQRKSRCSTHRSFLFFGKMPKEKPMLNASTFFNSLAKCQRKSRCSTHRSFLFFGKMPKEKPMLNASTFLVLWQNAKGKADAQRIGLFLVLWQNAKGKADAQRIDFPIGKIKILLLREKLIKWVDRLICGHSTGNRHNCRHSLRRNRRSFCAYACGRPR